LLRDGLLGPHDRHVGGPGRPVLAPDRPRRPGAALPRQGGDAARVQHPQQEPDPRRLPGDSPHPRRPRRGLDPRDPDRAGPRRGRAVVPVDPGRRGRTRGVPDLGARGPVGAGVVREARHRSVHRRRRVLATLSRALLAHLVIHGWLLATAAAVLSLERLTYVYVARRPERFRWACRHPAVTRLGEPVAVVRTLVALFKALQVATFVIWCVVHGDGRLWPAEADPVVLGLA